MRTDTDIETDDPNRQPEPTARTDVEDTDTEEAGDSPNAGSEAGETDAPARNDGTDTGGRGRRDVVVSRDLYRIVTVFSTLIAIGTVVGGFVLLDTATNRTLAAASAVNLPLAIGGVALIVLGAATYAFAARFRTRGMGSPNSDAGGDSGNG